MRKHLPPEPTRFIGTVLEHRGTLTFILGSSLRNDYLLTAYVAVSSSTNSTE
jgi:hypothetical protein